jgi:acyl transferase domain-containing protein/acyl carrier protein
MSPHVDRSDVDVAVIGLACRVPGARTPSELWENLSRGVDSISHFTDEELRAAGVAGSLLADTRYVKAAGVVGGTDLFDADFFGFTPNEARVTDPQHRFFLECAWEALEDAGWDPSRFGGRIGVYGGSGINTYLLKNVFPNRALVASSGGVEVLVASDKDFLTTRVSFKLGLEGPSVAVQTACSTSLVAVHLACQALVAGDCDMALAGGVTLRTPEAEGYRFEEGLIFAPDGVCRPFDARARGSVPASGSGVVVLKRLGDAQRERDHIYAVIRGSAVNNDGSSKVGYTAPRLAGQARCIRSAHAVADVAPRSISYIETHGSGTPIGDAIELGALQGVFGKGHEHRCLVGSIKSNIGHLDAAAGVAGLMKATLSLHHRRIPPSLHFEQASPELGLEAGPFAVARELEPWNDEKGPRRAGVSSFGLGGTNAHVVIEEAPEGPTRTQVRDEPRLLVLSARSDAALVRAEERLATHLASKPDLALADVAFTLGAGRRALAHRRAIVCESVAEAIGALRDPARVTHTSVEQRDLVFLFPGVGDQYPQMGDGLRRHEPRFREAFDRCAAILQAEHGLRLDDVLSSADGTARTTGTDLRAMLRSRLADDGVPRITLLHPALFAIEYALASVWLGLGAAPRAMIGYSLGEYVAACVAGVFSLESALRIVVERARRIETLEPGAMLAVSLSRRDAERHLGDGVWLAAANTPGMCVLSGEVETIERTERDLERAGVVARRVLARHAFHTEMMRPVASDLARLVRQASPRAPKLRFYSNLTGAPISDAEATDPVYWAAQMCRPVQLERAVESLCGESSPLFVEIGPGQGLTALAMQHPASRGAVAVPSMRSAHQDESDLRFLRHAVGRVWCAGVDLDLRGIVDSGIERRVPLPTYPFEHQRFWIEPPSTTQVTEVPERRQSDLRKWFQLPSWRRALPAVAGHRDGRWVVFRDRAGAADALIERLRSDGGDPIVVSGGDRFESHSDGSFCVRMDARADHEALLASLSRSPTGAALFLDAEPVGRDPEWTGYASVVAIAQAAAALGMSLRLVTFADEGPGAAAARAAGAVIHQEHREIACRFVTIDPSRARAIAGPLAAELGEDAPWVAIDRDGRRRTAAFDAAPLERAGEGLRTGGTYLVTGGLGAVGLVVARWLAQRARANIVLVGRGVVPPRAEWGRAIDTGDDERSGTLQALLDVEAAGGTVLTLSADVSEQVQMRAAIEATQERFDRLDGIFHLAGVTGDLVSVADATADHAKPHFDAKVRGVEVLQRVVYGVPLDFVVLFSSTASVLGGPGLLPYAAASAYLDAFAERKAGDTATRWVSVGWDGWLTSAVTREEAQRSAIGEFFMTSEEALDALGRILASSHRGAVLVAPGSLDARLQRWREARGRAAVPTADAPARRSSKAYVSPASDVEALIASMWCEVLGVERVGIHDSFFELGGDSLLGTKVVANIQRAFQVKVSMRQLWKSPTVAQIAVIVEELIIDELLHEEEAK